jgi:hypothetical protein
VVGDPVEHLLDRASVDRETMADHPGLMFIRRRTDIGRDYFVCLQDEARPIDGWVTLASGGVESVVLMDPLSGRTGLAASRKVDEGHTEVFLQLRPIQSIVIRTSTKRLDGPKWMYERSAGPAAALTGAWKIHFLEGGPELPADITSDHLASWTALGDTEKTQAFAGTARYSLTFDAPKGESFELDLGTVCHSARVRLNGREMGTLFAPPYRVRLEGLQPKGNVLEIDVTATAANRIRDLDRRGVQWRIFKDINLVTQKYKAFDASKWPVAESGLLGPVTLQPLASFDPAAATR